MADRLPVTVLSGFPGAGKTTLLNHLLAHGAGGRVGVLVCGAQDGQTLAPLPPGCEATVLPSAEALLAETARLAAEGRFDALLVEADGLDEPLAIAEAFLFEAEHGAGPEAAAQADTLVTVIDAATFLHDLNEAEFLADRGLAQGPDDDRTVAEVLVAQVECCDVIVLNKADLASAADLARLRAVLQALNPRADIVEASFGKVPPERVQGTGRFDFEAAADAPGWLAALRGEVPAVSADSASGVSMLVYRRRRPFHPQRFADLIHTEWLREHGSVLRSRGLFWLASRMDTAGDWNQSGGVCRHGGAGAWWAALDPAEWPADTAERAEVEADMQIGGAPAPFGDRRQELVLTGLDLNQAALQARLDACLLTDAEMSAGAAAWATYADPFPGWVDEFDDDHDHAHGHDHGDDCGCGDPGHDHGNHGRHPHAH
ncbi:GTP-binding protein [Cupriavidus sp. TMH.W2]|uniref:GTP-binding protein n=1 Tax=Cupriavidus sp. TMH.W2 TaxID=3434465 RepID=UPI003D76F97C